MTTKAEDNLAYVATLLAGMTGVAFLERSRAAALTKEQSPAVVIEPIREVADYSDMVHINWTQIFRVIIITRGDVAEKLADPIREQIHTRLMADRMLDGRVFDLVPVSAEFARDQGDLTVGATDLQYQCTYRTFYEAI